VRQTTSLSRWPAWTAPSAPSTRALPAARLAPIAYVTLVWGGVFGFLFFAEVPGLATIAGAALIVLGTLVTSVLAGYAFARLRFAGRDLLFIVFLGTMMIPQEVTLIPNFVLLSNLPCPIPIDTLCNPKGAGCFDTFTAISVPWWVSVFSIFLLRQFFLGIPSELWEASQLDGASHLRYLLRVVLPLSTPALLTVGLYAFVQSWKSFLWPLVMTSRPEVRPIQVGLSTFALENGTYYHTLMAASAFTIAPVVLLFILVQRHFLESIARSGLKG